MNKAELPIRIEPNPYISQKVTRAREASSPLLFGGAQLGIGHAKGAEDAAGHHLVAFGVLKCQTSLTPQLSVIHCGFLLMTASSSRASMSVDLFLNPRSGGHVALLP
jgi:hypothetical protein